MTLKHGFKAFLDLAEPCGFGVVATTPCRNHVELEIAEPDFCFNDGHKEL
jgi:hypothetical protein